MGFPFASRMMVAASDGPLPLFGANVASNVLAAYGTTKLYSAYAGAALQVQRASDNATLDIGFAAATNRMDAAALDTFLSGTTGRVVTWYDQTGNGNHATESFATAPDIGVAAWGSRAIRAISFSGNGTRRQKMTLPAGITGCNRNNYAVVSLKQDRSFAYFNGIAAWQVGLAAGNYQAIICAYDQSAATGYATRSAAGFTSSGFPSFTAPILSYLSTGSGTQEIYLGEESFTAAAPSSQVLANGGYIGADDHDATRCGTFDYVAHMVVSRGLTAQEKTDLKASAAVMGATSSFQAHVYCAGASTLEGSGSTFNRHLLRYTNPSFGARMFNHGVSGSTVANMSTRFAAWGTASKSASLKNIGFIFTGGNDIGAGTSAVDIMTALTTLRNSMIAGGFSLPIVATALPRTSFTSPQSTERAALNTSLRSSGWTLADFAADPIMGNPANTGDTTLFTDGEHPTSLGYSYLGPILAAALNTVYASL